MQTLMKVYVAGVHKNVYHYPKFTVFFSVSDTECELFKNFARTFTKVARFFCVFRLGGACCTRAARRLHACAALRVVGHPPFECFCAAVSTMS